MKQNKNKFFLFVFLIFILVYVFFNCFRKKSVSVVSFENLIYNENFITGMYVDNVLCSYDSNSNIYYSNIDDVSGISFYSMYDDLRYKVSSISDNLYKIYVYNDMYYYDLDLVISDIPIVNIHDLNIAKYKEKLDLNTLYRFDFSSYNVESSEKKIGISISNILQNNGKKSFSSFGYMTERGASSSFFEKKSYKLELNDKFGIYNVSDDDIWVLDALYIDSSKVRNKLSSDLWNLINDNQSINNDLKSVFVEVFIDDQYAGLYTLKEKVDKSVTKNTEDGILLKATMHLMDDRITKFLNDPNAIYDDMILNFEIKDYNSKSYYSFVKKMYYYYSGFRDYNAISNVYYINNYLNYRIFVALIDGQDNVTSNQYYSMINDDSKILITPWDMDLTWGLYWNLDTPLHSEFLYNNDVDSLNSSIKKDLDNQTMFLMRKRYWELRKSVITMDTINSYLDSYKDVLISSGAAGRDSNRWYEYDIEFEIEQLREWAKQRIEFLDEYFR